MFCFLKLQIGYHINFVTAVVYYLAVAYVTTDDTQRQKQEAQLLLKRPIVLRWKFTIS